MQDYVTDETVKEFIIENHSTMTNKEIAKVFNRKTLQIAGFKHHLKKCGEIKEVVANIESIEELYVKAKGNKTGLFNNVNSKGKLEARQMIAKWVGTNTKTNAPILTLPFEGWEMEKLIQNYTGKVFSYVACEKELVVFQKMVANSMKYGKNNVCYQGLIGEKIKDAKENQYSSLILDYCGVLGTFNTEIVIALLNKIVEVGGIIAITLQKARDTSDVIKKCYEASAKDDSISDTENAIRTYFKSICLISDFEVVDELVYTDKTPMMLTVLKRIK